MNYLLANHSINKPIGKYEKLYGMLAKVGLSGKAE
jgi:hypothetical protein